MSDDPWTETHRDRLEVMLDENETHDLPEQKAIRAALAEIARLTHENNVARDWMNRVSRNLDAALAEIARLRVTLKALADDYEQLCGDGLTMDNEPGVLRDAREVLRRQP